MAVMFEVAARFFSWQQEQESMSYGIGSYITSIYGEQVEQSLLLWSRLNAVARTGNTYTWQWEHPNLHEDNFTETLPTVPMIPLVSMQLVGFVFFLLTVVILLNLLIAMMGDTYSKHYRLAKEEWQLVVAGLIREYWGATVMPLPFSAVEIVINSCMVHFSRAEKLRQIKLRGDSLWG